MVAIANLKPEVIRRAVEQVYTEVANRPAQPFHFPVGRDACRVTGYPETETANLPESVVESFAGVGYPFAADAIQPGNTVLDVGSGSGTDVFLAARRVGTHGRIYALDCTAAMREKLKTNLAHAGLSNVEVLAGDAEEIPLPDRSVDVVTSNGVLNLIPDKTRAIAEIYRVLKPGGRIQISDIALAKPITGKAKHDPKLWAECIVGALEDERYLDMIRRAGFRHVEHVGSLDYFAHARNEDTRLMARYFGAHSITFRARKPEAFEIAHAPADGAAATRLVADGVKQIGAFVGGTLTAGACFGTPALVAAFSAIGGTALVQHAWLYPVFVGFLALSLWGLYRSAYECGDLRPFRLGLGGALFAAAALWFMVTGVYPLPGWTVYTGMALLIGGVGWTIGNRFLEVCIAKVRRELTQPKASISPTRRFANGAGLAVAAAAAFYGLHKSVDAVAPKAEASEIACYGINACKGQTQCATASNACPGLNACKSKGFRYTSSDECAPQGGVPLKGSPADPARSVKS